MSLEFRILGPIEMLGASGTVRLGGPKQRGVLAILLLRANQVVPVDEIASELYGDDVPATAVAQVRDHVSQLRKLLAEDELDAKGTPLETRAPGYLFRLEPDQLDAARFERRTSQAAGALARGEAGLAAEWLREALALWRGPPLAEFAYDSFAQPAIARLEELRLIALEQRIEADLALGLDGALVGELEALVREHPLRERLRAQLMVALYRSGRQAEALDVYHATRRTLVDDLGIEPSEELRALSGKILRHDSSLESPGAHQTAGSLPLGSRRLRSATRTRVCDRSTRRTPPISSGGRLWPSTSSSGSGSRGSSQWWDRAEAASRLSCAPGSSPRCG
jgi:DNA-binding SARP family transcriptional activator